MKAKLFINLLHNAYSWSFHIQLDEFKLEKRKENRTKFLSYKQRLYVPKQFQYSWNTVQISTTYRCITVHTNTWNFATWSWDSIMIMLCGPICLLFVVKTLHIVLPLSEYNCWINSKFSLFSPLLRKYLNPTLAIEL